MAKKSSNNQNEVHVIWVIITCVVLYGLICHFNGPEYQRELSQENVRKFAAVASAAWFFISIIILRKQGTRVVLFKSKKKKASENTKVAKGAAKAAAAGISKTKQGSSRPAPAEDTFILKDPATGAERLFTKDPETGEWVSEDGQSVLNTDQLPEWYQTRTSDRDFINHENEKLKNGEGWLDQKLKKEEEAFKAEQARLDEEYAVKLKNLQKYGCYTDDPEKIRQIIKRNQELEALNARIQGHYGNAMAFAENSFTVLSKVCDYSVDVLAEMTGPAGKYVVRNLYITGRNVGSRWSEAVNYEKDEWEAVKRGGYDSLIDMTQASVGDKYKMAANVGGDAIKGGMDAYENGEDIIFGALDGASTGYLRTKAGQLVDSGFSKLTKGYMQSELKKLDVLKGKLSSGKISENVYKGIRNVQMNNAAQNIRLINKGGKTVVGDMVDDLVKWTVS